MIRKLAILTGSLLMHIACAPEESIELPPPVWEGQNVRVRMESESIQICGGTFEGLDRHAALARDAMLLDWNGKFVEYSIGDSDFVGEACRTSNIGCTHIATGHVFSRYAFLPHEIVHSVRFLDPQRQLHSSPIEEGLATLFGSRPQGMGTIPLNALETLQAERIEGGNGYYRAGHLMAMLFDEYGTSSFREFDLAASSMDEDQAFTQVFGQTKEDFASLAERLPHCEPSQWWQPLLECAGPPALPDPETGQLLLAGNLECSSPDVYGPTLNNMWTSRHFRVAESTSPILYEFDFPEDTTLEIISCNGGCPERFSWRGQLWETGSLGGGVPSLEPGDYFVRLSRPPTSDPGPFRIVLR